MMEKGAVPQRIPAMKERVTVMDIKAVKETWCAEATIARNLELTITKKMTAVRNLLFNMQTKAQDNKKMDGVHGLNLVLVLSLVVWASNKGKGIAVATAAEERGTFRISRREFAKQKQQIVNKLLLRSTIWVHDQKQA